MCDRLKEFLAQAGFSHLIEIFLDNQIDDYTLLLMQEADIKELIPILGERIKFKKSLEDFKRKIASLTETEQSAPTNDHQIFPEFTLNNINDGNGYEITIAPIDGMNETLDTNSINLNNSVSSSSSSSSNGSIKLKLRPKNRTWSVREVLHDSIDGKQVLSVYEKRRGLTATERNILTTCILNKIYEDEMKPNNVLWTSLAKEIAEEFPLSELETFYYSPSLTLKTGKKKAASGRLPAKFGNLKKKFKAAGLFDSSKSDNDELLEENERLESGSELENVEFTNNEKVKLLGIICEPVEDVIQLWRDTFDIRRSFVLTNSKYKPSHYLLKFKILADGHELSTRLINEDFKRLFPNSVGQFYLKWPQLRKFIIHMAKVKKLEMDDVLFLENQQNTDYGFAKLLSVLPSLINYPGSLKIKGNRKQIHPTALEVIRHFWIHIPDCNELDDTIAELRNYCLNAGLTLQPFIISVGPSLITPLMNYVIIDSIKYPYKSPMEAFDICMKSFYVLNMDYPVFAKHIWIALIEFFYNVNNDDLLKYQQVQEFVNDAKLFN